MYKSSLDYIFCVRCKGTLELDVLSENHEINEGFLYCKRCRLCFPIISKVAVLWDDFASYLSHRRILGGKLYVAAKNPRLKSFIKKSLSGDFLEDYTRTEERWCGIYQKNSKSPFYSKIKSHLNFKSELALEHGCSIGILAEKLSGESKHLFGIDKSFSAIQAAKKRLLKNADFFVADSLNHPFPGIHFDVVIALNLLEIVEPARLIKTMSNQVKDGFLIISDPYDFDRGERSIKKPLDEKSLREEIQKNGFAITSDTLEPSSIPWKLQLNPRAELTYLVDLVIAKKIIEFS